MPVLKRVKNVLRLKKRAIIKWKFVQIERKDIYLASVHIARAFALALLYAITDKAAKQAI